MYFTYFKFPTGKYFSVNLNENIFKSVNRASTSQGSYDRISPVAWTGGPQDNSLVDKNRLILGEFLKLSHGPRRKRRDLVVDTEPASHTEYAR